MSSTTKAERAARRREVAERLRKGESYAEISDALGCSKSTVARDVKKLRAQWREERDDDFSAHVAEHLAELREVKRRAFRAFLESREDTVTVTTEGEGREATSVTPEGELESEAAVTDVETVTKRVEKSPGDPRFLRVYLRAQREIGRVVGIDAWSSEKQQDSALDTLIGNLEAMKDTDVDERYSDEPMK